MVWEWKKQKKERRTLKRDWMRELIMHSSCFRRRRRWLSVPSLTAVKTIVSGRGFQRGKLERASFGLPTTSTNALFFRLRPLNFSLVTSVLWFLGKLGRTLIRNEYFWIEMEGQKTTMTGFVYDAWILFRGPCRVIRCFEDGTWMEKSSGNFLDLFSVLVLRSWIMKDR